MNLPSAMQFKKAKDNDWFAEYNWASFPSVDIPAPVKGAGLNKDLQDVKENKQHHVNSQLAKSSMKRATSARKGSVSFAKGASPIKNSVAAESNTVNVSRGPRASSAKTAAASKAGTGKST